jgi:hypothetical protein
MSDQAPHPTGPRRGADAVLLRLVIWLFVLLAGLAVVIVLPMILVLNATGGGRPGIWPLYVWLPVVFLACIYAIVTGLQAMDDPRPRRVAGLAGITVAAFLSFPPFWLPES